MMTLYAQVPHNRLGVDGMRAREAAERVVAAAENDGSTSGDLVQVDVGTVSPMVGLPFRLVPILGLR